MKLWIIALILSAATFAHADALKPYKIDPARVTVSGISSGAFMAVQLHVAYSSVFSGAASIAGGIYWCAEGDGQRAQTTCMYMPQSIQSSDQIAKAKALAASGDIDPLSNLANHPVYIYASPKDMIINPMNSDKLVEFYSAFTSANLIRTEHSIESAHGMPTLDQGNACNLAMSPWILKCNYDAAGELLKTMYGNLQPRGQADASHLLQFSQADFGNAQTPLFATGWIYVPTACANGETCGLHVALHGCQMNPDYIQDQFVKEAGYNEWAETNHMIILYPQSAKLGQANPYACWDWFGFTGANYVTKSGAQMTAIKKMVDRVMGR